jgi:hypothetical protein
VKHGLLVWSQVGFWNTVKRALKKLGWSSRAQQ